MFASFRKKAPLLPHFDRSTDSQIRIFQENSFVIKTISTSARYSTCEQQTRAYVKYPPPPQSRKKVQYPIELIWKCFFSNFLRVLQLLTCQNELSLLLLLLMSLLLSTFFSLCSNSKFYLVCAKFNVQTYTKISFIVDWNGRCIDFH